MNRLFEALLEQFEIPLQKLLFDHELYNRFRYNLVKLGCVLGAHLLEDGDVESLGYGAVLLLLENFNHLV